MILRELKEILTERGEATLPELVAVLRCERQMIRAAIDYWKGRGQIIVVEPNEQQQAQTVSCKSSCTDCGLMTLCSTPTVHYRWIDRT